MLLVLGAPGFLQYFFFTVPYSILSIVVWGTVSFGIFRHLDRTASPEDRASGSGAVRGCAIPLILVSIVFVPWISARWHPIAQSLAFWCVPVLLFAMAVGAFRVYSNKNERTKAHLLVPILFQLQMMAAGVLLWIGHIANGGSPI